MKTPNLPRSPMVERATWHPDDRATHVERINGPEFNPPGLERVPDQHPAGPELHRREPERRAEPRHEEEEKPKHEPRRHTLAGARAHSTLHHRRSKK